MTQSEKTERSRERIIQAAMQEFQTNTFQSASIRRICQIGGVTNGRFFHHFKTKAELYLVCAERYFEMLGAYVATFEADPKMDFEQNSLSLYAHWQNFWRIHPELTYLFIQLRVNPPAEIAEELLSVRRRTFVRRLKLILHDMLTLYYPDDPEQQAFLTGVWLSILDYTLIGVGLQKVDLYPDMESWMHSQKIMFQKLLCAFLYGINSEEFAELRREQLSPYTENDFPN